MQLRRQSPSGANVEHSGELARNILSNIKSEIYSQTEYNYWITL